MRMASNGQRFTQALQPKHAVSDIFAYDFGFDLLLFPELTSSISVTIVIHSMP